MHLLVNKWTLILLTMVVFQFSVLVTASATISTKSTTNIDQMPDTSIKCGECPCLNPCSQQLPSLPPPPPPPPQLPPPPPPPKYCGPPPPPRFIYVTGAPGNLYQSADPFNLGIVYNASHNLVLNIVGAFILVVCSALQCLVF